MEAAQLIWILGIIAQARTQYKTTIVRNGTVRTNQILVQDHVIIEKCAVSNSMNCTEVCRRDCKPGESLWWMKNTLQCAKDDFLIKYHEGCHFFISTENDDSSALATFPPMSIASLLHQQTTNIVNQSHKLMTLYQTKRTKVWYKYPLLRCGLLRSQHECVIVQLPTPTPATPKGIKDEEANEEGVKMKLECVSSEQLNQCLRIESRGLYGNKGIYIKVVCDDKTLAPYKGLIFKLHLFCTYQFGSSLVHNKSCLLFKIPGSKSIEGKMAKICKNNSTCNVTSGRETLADEEMEANNQTLPFLFGIILFILVIVSIIFFSVWKKRKTKEKEEQQQSRRRTMSVNSTRSSIRSTTTNGRRPRAGTNTSVSTEPPHQYERMTSNNGIIYPASYPSRCCEESLYLEPIDVPSASMTLSHNHVIKAGKDYQHYSSMQGNYLQSSTYEMLYPPKYEEPTSIGDGVDDSRTLLYNRQATTLSQEYEVMNSPDDKV